MEQSIENLYKLDGRVPVAKALPFGLQHVLAMFVSNIAPIMILAGAVGLDSSVSAVLIQNCMVIAGIGTLVQLYPVWRIGSRLPIVMGISFTFLSGHCHCRFSGHGNPHWCGDHWWIDRGNTWTLCQVLD